MESLWYRLIQVHVEKWPSKRREEAYLSEEVVHSEEPDRIVFMRFLRLLVLTCTQLCQNTEGKFSYLDAAVIYKWTLLVDWLVCLDIYSVISTHLMGWICSCILYSLL